MTASRASSLRLPIPKAPIAATEMLAPATAAKTSIMAGGCYSSSLAVICPALKREVVLAGEIAMVSV
jgi:hypothetical protein